MINFVIKNNFKFPSKYLILFNFRMNFYRRIASKCLILSTYFKFTTKCLILEENK